MSELFSKMSLILEKVALAIMVKDEEDHVLKTLESVKEYIDTYIVLDTGSSDKTIETVQSWCREENKILHLQETQFIDFEVTRNEMLDFSDAIEVDWLLLADASDEFVGDWEELQKMLDTEATGILLQQRWKSHGSIDVYMNNRLIRARAGWRYKGVVHEYLWAERGKTLHCPPTFYIFQDRTTDGAKSCERFKKDYQILKRACGRTG